MPAPLLSLLGAAARLAYPYLRGAVRAGISSRRVIRTLQTLGLGVRRQTVLNIMRADRSIMEFGRRLRFLRMDASPSVRRIPFALTKLSRRFSFLLDVSGFDVETQEAVIKRITISSSKTLPRGVLQNTAIEIVEGGKSRYGITTTGALLVEATQAGDEGLI